MSDDPLDCDAVRATESAYAEMKMDEEKEDRKRAYVFLAELFAKYRGSEIEAGDFAEAAFIALHRQGWLADHMEPTTGPGGGDMWERGAE